MEGIGCCAQSAIAASGKGNINSSWERKYKVWAQAAHIASAITEKNASLACASKATRYGVSNEAS